MSPSQADRGQPRRAALMAHALSPQDQAWLLAALPADGRAALEGLLAELHELGIPADTALLEALQPPAVSPAAPRGAGLLAALSARQVRALAQVLEREGVAVAGSLLSLRAWAWRRDLLAAMHTDFAQAVARTAVRPPALALEDALCAELRRELDAAMLQPRRISAPVLWQCVARAVRLVGART